MAAKLYCIAVKSDKQLDTRILSCVDYIIYSPEKYDVKIVERFLFQCTMHNAQCTIKDETTEKAPSIYLDLPVIAMSKDIKILRDILSNNEIKEKLAGIVANNIYALKLAEEYGLDVFKGLGMNTLNDNFCGFNNIILSPELNERDYRLFKGWDKKNFFLCVYGRLPLMALAHCLYRANGFDCRNCEGAKLQYKDEPGNIMDIRRIRLASCFFELLNSVPLNLLNYKNKVKPHYYFDMRETEKAEILRILKLFKEPGNKEPEGKYTTGLYFKEVK